MREGSRFADSGSRVVYAGRAPQRESLSAIHSEGFGSAGCHDRVRFLLMLPETQRSRDGMLSRPTLRS